MDKTITIDEKLTNYKKGIEAIVEKRYSAVAEIKVCDNEVKNIIQEIKELGVDPKQLGNEIEKIDEAIKNGLKELEGLDAVLNQYKELDISTVKDMEEVEGMNLEKEF